MKKLFLLIVLFVFIGASSLFAQTRVITGTVTSAVEGEGPVPGVTVFVKGTTIATATDINGKYSLTVPESATTLVFTYIGMKTQEIEIAGRSLIDCAMESDLVNLNEVIVTALGIKREKREVTYQTQKVGNEELSAVQPTRAASSLAGKVAGLQITTQDNGVNPTTQITLRGYRSVTNSNQALVVIDGGISTIAAFDDLNPNDIADVSILKGATAAALYGSKAANGAILVSTKKGQAGQRFTVGLTSSYTAEKVAYMPKFQSQYGTGWEGAYDAIENTNWGPRFDGTMRQIGPTWADGSYQEVPYAPVKNNLLDFFNTGNTFNNTFYVSGSNETSKFYISAGQQNTTGIVPNDDYKRNTFRVNASKKLGNVELSVNSSFFSDETDKTGEELGAQDRPLYWFLLNTSANIPLKNYKNWRTDKYSTPNGYYNGYYENPYYLVDNARELDDTKRINSNVQASWDVLTWLNITGRVGVNNVWGDGKNWRAALEYDSFLKPSGTNVTSFVEDEEFQQEEYTGDLLATANFKFSDFTLKTIVGATTFSHKYRYSEIRANNLSIPGFYDISNGSGTPVVTADANQNRNYGFFGDFTLGYKNYLFLNFSGRNDWTSTLAQDNNSYFYPAVGLSFVATDAIEALKNNDILSFAKATISNSTVYNDLDAYKINETYSKHGSFPYGATSGFILSTTTVDANIKKEKLNTTEVGVNLGFLKSRIFLDASYFVTKTTDLITSTTPSIASGAESFLTNIGELQSKGLELTLGGTVLQARDFSWDLSINFSNPETTVKSIKEGLDEIALSTNGQRGVYAVVGQAFPQIKANTYQRDPQGRIIVDGITGIPKTNAELSSLGKTTPDYILGANSSLKFKGFTLAATIDYRTGYVFYAQGSDLMEFTGRSLESVSSNRQDFVIPNSVIETAPGTYVANTNVPISGGRQSYWTDVYNEVKENYVRDAT
ncbi:MAG TPA: SusC/RagA family TonB-linked outer membrane protein, partial [Bacteroidales bacterium]|nr:SusC/RagA family TonB-linked outer membrane protein [Bacteroidales bacterium]